MPFRDLVNPVYAILIRAILSAIQRIAAMDAKHGTRLSMENYIQLENILREFAEASPILAFFIKTAEANKEKALQVSASHLLPSSPQHAACSQCISKLASATFLS